MAAKRKVICPKCKAKLILDPDKITSAAVTFGCPGCASVLRFKKQGLPKEIFSFPASDQPLTKAGINKGVPGTETLDLARRLDMEMGFAGDDQPGKAQKAGREAEPGRSEEVTEDFPITRTHPPGEEDGPLIPEDKLVAPAPPGETLLEEFTRDKLREFEEGEPEAGDTEWTRFADNRGKKLAASKIDMNKLPPSFTFLKETLIKLRQAEELNLKGETRSSKNLYNQAVKDFSRALEINPNYVDALINRGSALARLGRFNNALMDFNHALKFEKYDAEIYNRRGEIYLQNNMHDQAIKDFTSALVLDPMYSYAYLNRGRAYSGKGMPEEAMRDFKEAIRSDLESTPANLADHVSPGGYNAEEESANMQKAAAFNEQGLADLKNEKYEEAVKNFTRAVSLSSGDAEGYANRGQAYIKLFQPDKAMADLNQAVRLAPLNPTLYFWRAQAWKAKDDPSSMAEDLKLSCELGYEPACLAYSKIRPPKKQSAF